MPFVDSKKKIILTKSNGENVCLEGVVDIGPAEGFEGFICFWRLDETLPFYLLPRTNIASMSVEALHDNS